jgi:pyruvate dehydrogenase E1 component beta subunit
MLAAIRDENPVFCLESERMLAMTGDVPEDDFTIEIGSAKIVRPGADCTLLGFGRTVHFCLEAAEALASEGIDCEVIDGRSVKPLDMKTIAASVRRTNCCVVVDQSWSFASIGSEIAAEIHRLCFDDLDNHVHRVHSDDVPAPYAWNLEQEMLPNARKICEAVRSATYTA